MSTGGRGRRDDWPRGGRSARPRYLTLMAPSPPAPNGHQADARTGRRTPSAERLSPKALGLALAGVLLAGPIALAVWALWRLAMAGG